MQQDYGWTVAGGEVMQLDSVNLSGARADGLVPRALQREKKRIARPFQIALRKLGMYGRFS
jgi:hypothetical protein